MPINVNIAPDITCGPRENKLIPADKCHAK